MTESNASPNRWQTAGAEWLALAGFCFLFLFAGLANFGLIGPDEPRYAQVAREMFSRGDWVTPTLGGQPWLEKPVLYYWEAMASYSVFGVSDWAARLPGAVSATLLVLGIFLFFRRFRPGGQLDAALIALTSVAFVGFGRAAATDMPLASCFGLAMLAWFAWVETDERRWLALFYFFSGAGVLAKGPVAVFFAVVVIGLYALWMRVPGLIWRTLWLPGIALFLLTMLPWYTAVQMRNPEFFRVFFLEHNLARFSSNLYRHEQPFWYYIPVALAGWLPWTALVATSLVTAVRAVFRRDGDGDGTSTGDTFTPFLVVWTLVPIVFFSLSHSKLPGYILPAMPAGAMLLADRLWRMRRANTGLATWLMLLHALLAGALVAPALWMEPLLLRQPIPTALRIEGIAAAIAAALVIFLLLRSRGLGALRIATILPVAFVMLILLRTGGPLVDASNSARSVDATLRAMDAKGMPVALAGPSRSTEYGLQFYRNESIANYERGEMPGSEHLLVVKGKSADEVKALLPGRRAVRVGIIGPQKLEIYWVQAVQ